MWLGSRQIADPIPGMESIAIGALPALRSWNPDLNRDLKDIGAVRRSRFFTALVAAQTAFAVLLLAGAGVTDKSLCERVIRGVDKEQPITFMRPLADDFVTKSIRNESRPSAW